MIVDSVFKPRIANTASRPVPICWQTARNDVERRMLRRGWWRGWNDDVIGVHESGMRLPWLQGGCYVYDRRHLMTAMQTNGWASSRVDIRADCAHIPKINRSYLANSSINWRRLLSQRLYVELMWCHARPDKVSRVLHWRSDDRFCFLSQAKMWYHKQTPSTVGPTDNLKRFDESTVVILNIG